MFDFHQPVVTFLGRLNDDRFNPYLDALLSEFAESAEARGLREEIGWVETVLDLAYSHLGRTPTAMKARDVEQVLFEILPLKVAVTADCAGAIVAELRAFWRFVERQYGAENAVPISKALNDSVVNRLRTELHVPLNVGHAKEMVVAVEQPSPRPSKREPNGFDKPVLAAASAKPSNNEVRQQRKDKRKQQQTKKRGRR